MSRIYEPEHPQIEQSTGWLRTREAPGSLGYVHPQIEYLDRGLPVTGSPRCDERTKIVDIREEINRRDRYSARRVALTGIAQKHADTKITHTNTIPSHTGTQALSTGAPKLTQCKHPVVAALMQYNVITTICMDCGLTQHRESAVNRDRAQIKRRRPAYGRRSRFW